MESSSLEEGDDKPPPCKKAFSSSSPSSPPSLAPKVLSLVSFLSPFLGHDDLLNLSQTAQWLLPYRHELPGLSFHPRKGAQVSEPPVLPILAKQRRLAQLHLGFPASNIPRVMTILGQGHCSSLLCLDLSYLSVGAEGLLALAAALTQGGIPSLRELDLTNAEVTSCGMERLACALKMGKGKQLRRLLLGGNSELGCRGVMALADALMDGACHALEELELAEVNLGPEGICSLAHALANGGCPSLRLLNLSEHQAGPALAALTTAFQCGACPQLRSLNLAASSCEGSEAIRGLGQACLVGGLPHLEELWLQGHAAEVDDIQHLALALQYGSCPSLLRLSLGGVGLNERSTWYLARALAADNACPRLQELHLDTNTIRCEGAVHLATALGQCLRPTLRVLNLGDNGIGEVGIRALSEAFRHGGCPRLEELLLASNPVGDGGMRELAGVIEAGSFPLLTRLDVGDCQIGSGGACHFAAALLSSSHRGHVLQELSLNNNEIRATGALALSQALTKGALANLQELDLGQTRIGHGGARHLLQQLSPNIFLRL